jgi:hypothetical protein
MSDLRRLYIHRLFQVKFKSRPLNFENKNVHNEKMIK